MTGNIDEPRSLLPIIKKDPDDSIQYMYRMLNGMINRALPLRENGGLDNQDLRGWHLVLNGSILLHLSPYGFDEGMNGRYAFISDSYSLIKDGILRLRRILENTEIEVNTVVPLPDRASRILGIAASKLLNIPISDWNDFGPEDPGLIVAYDLHDIEDPELSVRLHNHHPKQILWAHATCWTIVYPYSADLTTYLYQSKTAPWDAQLLFNDDEVQMSSADESSENDLAEFIVNAERDESYFDDADALVELVECMKQIDDLDKPGIFQVSGKRLRLREGSPVRSNVFR
jgi:hypothetical protein